MNNSSKFYEEKLHERELPNKNGQFLNGSRYANQDWYGNELVFHKEKTYFGEILTSIKPEELSFNPKTIFNYLNNQVREFLKRLIIIVPDANLELGNLQVFIQRTYGHPDAENRRERSVYVYEDDGNTRTEGFHYEIYFALPLSDSNQDLEYAVRSEYAYPCGTIVFKLEFNERIHDSKISGRFFSLYFNGVMEDEESRGKKVDTRIDYNNDNRTINSIINPENLFRVGKKLVEYKQDEDLLRKAKLAFEQ